MLHRPNWPIIATFFTPAWTCRPRPEARLQDRRLAEFAGLGLFDVVVLAELDDETGVALPDWFWVERLAPPNWIDKALLSDPVWVW